MWRYRFVLAILAPALIVYLGWLAIRNRDWRFFYQRLGLTPANTAQTRDIWFHAVSVGEVHAVAPLLAEIHERNPNLAILLTTSTPTGATAAIRILGERIQHAYLPIDWRWAMQRLLRATQPNCVFIVETELWPNLYALCARQGIPLTIINGRLSSRTLKAKPWLLNVYRQTLDNARLVLARSETDADRFRQIGCPTNKLKVIGNLKFAASADAPEATPINLNRPYVLAASTHEDEEKQLTKMWLANDFADHLLVIVPRHPLRLPAILKQLTILTTQVAVRSRNDPVTAQTHIYLADTFGELAGFMCGAELVFMGGSLVPHGGQNIIEPARLGKAVLFGPYMHNFEDEVRLLIEDQAAIQVADTQSLAQTIHRLLASLEQTHELGSKAAKLTAQQSDMAKRYLEEMSVVCPSLVN